MAPVPMITHNNAKYAEKNEVSLLIDLAKSAFSFGDFSSALVSKEAN
jgi:hypothetical protein